MEARREEAGDGSMGIVVVGSPNVRSLPSLVSLALGRERPCRVRSPGTNSGLHTDHCCPGHLGEERHFQASDTSCPLPGWRRNRTALTVCPRPGTRMAWPTRRRWLFTLGQTRTLCIPAHTRSTRSPVWTRAPTVLGVGLGALGAQSAGQVYPGLVTAQAGAPLWAP